MSTLDKPAETQVSLSLYLSLSLNLAQSPTGAISTPEVFSPELALSGGRRRLEQPSVVAPEPLVRGDDLMAELDLEAGPQVGRILEKIREAQAAGEIRTRDEALRLARNYVERSAPAS